MANGDNITLLKTISNVPWFVILGALQNLDQRNLDIMLRKPWFSWLDDGIPYLKVTKIPTTPATGSRFPIGNIGAGNLAGNGATVDTRNWKILKEGTLSCNSRTLCFEAGTQDEVTRVLGMYPSTDNGSIDIFRNNNDNKLYAGVSLGVGNNMGTFYLYIYEYVNRGIAYGSSTLNFHCEPVDDRQIYINNQSVKLFGNIDFTNMIYSELSFDFFSSMKIFTTAQSMGDYRDTGNDSGEIDNIIKPETPAEDRKTELFYKSTIYKRVDGVQKDVKVGESNITFVVQYKSNDGTENYPAIGQVAGYVNDFSPVNTSTWGNIKWKKSSNAKIVQIKVDYTGEDGVRHSQTYQPLNFPYNAKNYGFYESYQNGTIRYYSKYATNMRIYANESDIDSYLGGDPTIKPLYDGNTGKISPTDYIGDPVVYNSIDYIVDADMSSCWILTKEQVDELAEVFATGLTKEEGDDNTLINITKTCARSFMAQSEPIDAVVDLFWLPIDVTGFCTSEDDNMTFSYDRYGILNGAKTIIDGTGEAMTVAESNTLRIGDGIGKLFNPINNLSTNIGATIGSAGSTSEVINTYSGTTPAPSNE